jgi:YidC/Oxa1 family membrane protein insertase
MDTVETVFGPIIAPLGWLLEWLHTDVGLTWAWAIVALTVIVRIAMIPLTVKQQQSFRAMQMLQPEIKKIQQKHKGDRQKLNEEMMAFYRENKVNPFGSCLPLLVQLPIFFALYLLLRDLGSEVEAGANLSMFWGWIPDITESLSELPGTTLWPLMLLYIVSQMGATLLMPTSMDPKQKYIFLFLPIVYAYFIVYPPIGVAFFPAGLLIYWITTNLWTVGQAAVIRFWFPPPIPPSAKTQTAKAEGGGIAARLGLGGDKRSAGKRRKGSMPKAEKKRDADGETVASEAKGATAARSGKKRSGKTRVKRPPKPRPGGAEG